jgi:beta-glucosidase/6-phospho-beta-glucosidase/beta-galactosidase
MFHWDLPQFIQDLGGFTNPLLVDYFKVFVEVLYKNFGNRVKKWITFNEPLNFCVDGYGTGKTAPGIKASGVGEYLCAHHLLQAHSMAYHLYKDNYFKTQQGQIGISLNSRSFYPKDESVDENLANRLQEYRVKINLLISKMLSNY